MGLIAMSERDLQRIDSVEDGRHVHDDVYGDASIPENRR